MGYVEVSEPTNSKVCRESFAKLYQEYKSGICDTNPAILWITGYELRIVDKRSIIKKLTLIIIVDTNVFTIKKILYTSCGVISESVMSNGSKNGTKVLFKAF